MAKNYIPKYSFKNVFKLSDKLKDKNVSQKNKIYR